MAAVVVAHDAQALGQPRDLRVPHRPGAAQRVGEDYDWPVVERKYLEMFDRLKEETLARAADPLPGWFERRRQDLPPARDVLAKLPTGAAVQAERRRA